MTRLFFALDLTDKTKMQLFQWQKNNLPVFNLLTEPYPKAIPFENFHITLAFLGTIEPFKQSAFSEYVDHISVELYENIPIKLQLDYCGLFKKPKVLYLANSVIPARLKNLAHILHNKAVSLDIHQEHQTYRPHISLYRKALNLPKLLAFNPIDISINSFSLYQSVAKNNGVTYQPIKTWYL